MRIDEILRESREKQETAEQRSRRIRELVKKLNVRGSTLKQEDFIEFLERVLTNQEITAALNEIRERGVEIIIRSGGLFKGRIGIDDRGELNIDQGVSLTELRSFLEISSQMRSA